MSDPRTTPGHSAREVASWLRPGDAVPWRAVEIGALAEHPRLQDALDRKKAWPRLRAARRRWWLGVVGVVGLSALVLPMFGIAAVARGRFTDAPDYARAIPLAGVLDAVAALVLLVVVAGWLLGRERASALGVAVGYAALCLPCAALTAWLMWRGAVFDGLVGWAGWLAAPAGLALLALAVLGAAQVAHARRDPAAAVPRGEPLAGVRRLVAALPDDVRAGLAADLRGAVDDLERRGVIDAVAADRARSAPLAMLAHEMSGAAGRQRG